MTNPVEARAHHQAAIEFQRPPAQQVLSLILARFVISCNYLHEELVNLDEQLNTTTQQRQRIEQMRAAVSSCTEAIRHIQEGEQ